MDKTTESDFQRLLLELSQEGNVERRKQIESALWERYGSTATFLVVDMARYSKSEREHGVVHCLSMIRRLRRIIRPIVESHGGSLVACHADNVDARFAVPVDAINTCLAINRALKLENTRTPEALDLHVSCGIDHGACLVEDESHVYGTPVIRASKLGEDVGRAGQILITKKAMQLVPDALDLELEKLTTRIAGVDVDVFSILPG